MNGGAALGAACLAAYVTLCPAPALAQAHEHAGARAASPAAALTLDSAAFLARARAAGARYREQGEAIADGFRPLGPDFPGMAQHWISVSRLMRGGFDPDEPAVLTYAEVGGAPVLLGLAWTVVLSPDASPPASPEGAQWHEHVHTIDEESAMLHQLRAGAGQARSRLAMMHAWLWLENPDGVFASDNWSAPFLRAGLAPPRLAHREAALALSLLGDGVDYWTDVARVRAGATPAELLAIGPSLRAARDGVATLAGAGEGRIIAPAELSALATIWRETWEHAAAEVSRARREAVRAIGR